MCHRAPLWVVSRERDHMPQGRGGSVQADGLKDTRSVRGVYAVPILLNTGRLANERFPTMHANAGHYLRPKRCQQTLQRRSTQPELSVCHFALTDVAGSLSNGSNDGARVAAAGGADRPSRTVRYPEHLRGVIMQTQYRAQIGRSSRAWLQLTLAEPPPPPGNPHPSNPCTQTELRLAPCSLDAPFAPQAAAPCFAASP